MVEAAATNESTTQAETEAPTQQIGDVLHLTNDRGVIKKILKVGEPGDDI